MNPQKNSRWIRRLLFVTLVAAFVSCEGPRKVPSGNVLLITIDTLRADHVGAYGATAVATPVLDRLAAEGLLYEQAVASVPITLPSHATILTGLDVPHHGVRHNGLFVLEDRFETLAEVLLDRGYQTAAFTGAFVLDERYGLQQGFEHYDDDVHIEGGKRPGGTFVERDAGVVIERALAWIANRDADRPFFVWVHLYDPHAPYQAPAPWGERYSANPYSGEVAWVDDRIGHLLAGIRESGLWATTLTVVTSDHGEGLGQHDEWTHADLIYDATMRVPLIFAGPTYVEQPQRIVDRLAATIDIVPTILSLLEIPFDADRYDGLDLVHGEIPADRTVHIETMAPLLDYGWSSLHGLRSLRTKFISAPTAEFYDLAQDPDEATNLYTDDPRAIELEQRLTEIRNDWDDDLALLHRGRVLDPDEKRRLRSLGYVAGRSKSSGVGGEDPKEMMGVWRRMREAVDLARNGQHKEAQSAIDSILSEQSTSARAWYSAAIIYEMGGAAERVEHAMRQAVALQPRSEGFVTLARYALQRKDEAAFREALDSAVELDPDDGGIAIGLGHWHISHGRVEQARAAFRRAIEVDPVRSGPYARRQLALIDAAVEEIP